MKTALTFVVVLAAACGGKSSGTAAPTGATGEHGAMSPELTRFHDVLAPRWHAEKGPKRMEATCSAIGDFRSTAEALATSSPPPSAEAASWTTGTKELTEAVGGLEATCKANDAAGFEPAFERMHTVFHALMELGDAHGGHEHGDHEDGDHEHGDHEHGDHEHGHDAAHHDAPAM